MKNIVLILLSLMVVFSGCSNKSTLFNKNDRERSVVINSRKGELYNSLEIKATIVSTYLNASIPEYKDKEDENFLISIYIDGDSSQKDKQGIYNKEYSLTLNSKQPSDIKLLKFEDDLIKLTPIRNRWSNYYLVRFNRQSGDDLKMIFKNDAFGEVVLKFQKEY
jgi:phage anti-repressor protein